MKRFTEIDHRITGRDPRSSKPHNDRAIEIIQTWSDGGYFLINNRIFPIESGAVYLINAIETHCSNPADFDSYNRSKIIVDYDFFMEIMRNVGMEELLLEQLSRHTLSFSQFSLQNKVPYQIDTLFKQASDAFGSPSPLSEAIQCCAAMQILILLLGNKTNEDPKNLGNSGIINDIMAYINENVYSLQSISLDNICSEAHISKSYLCHLFKRTTGLSVMQYINNVRVTQAKKLLIETNMKIQDIASSLGYSTSTFFCKSFKSGTGVSPAHYRASHKS